jgi:chemotaxis protein MotB
VSEEDDAPLARPAPHRTHAAGAHAGHKAHEEEGEGNWLVSYADMMTLLVGFFVILLSFSTVDQEKLDKAKLSITKEFGGSYKVPYADMAERIKAALDKLGLGDQFIVKQTPSGVDISFQGTVFFNSGSADIKPEARALVNELIPVVKQESQNFDITIEGHTDDVPLSGGQFIKNNWELSSLRACRVLDAFFAHGFDQKHMTAIGYGEARPIAPNRDAEGNPLPENQSQNRRVVIKLTQRPQGALAAEKPQAPAIPVPDQPSHTAH